MKLELARAMLYKADLLLLDEVSTARLPDEGRPDHDFPSPLITWTGLPLNGWRTGSSLRSKSLA
jgi:hypothetical protein